MLDSTAKNKRMKKTTGKVFFRFIVHILLIALLSAFYVGVFEKIAEAQQNYHAPVITGVSSSEAEVSRNVERGICGGYFLPGAKFFLFHPASVTVNWVKIISAVELIAGIIINKDALLETRNATIGNPNGQSYTAKNIFYLKAVTLPYVVIVNISVENKTQQLCKSVCSVITGLKR